MGSTPGKQATRQAARRAAAEAQATLMRARLERDRRCAALGVQVVAALRERDDLVQRYERQAGEALRALVVDEAVGAAEAVQWCAGAVTTREVARLRRLAEALPDDGAGGLPGGRGGDASTSDGADVGHPHVGPATVSAARREAHREEPQ